MEVPVRLRKANIAPEKGSFFKVKRQAAANPSSPRLKSTEAIASNSRCCGVICSIDQFRRNKRNDSDMTAWLEADSIQLEPSLRVMVSSAHKDDSRAMFAGIDSSINSGSGA